MTTPDYPALIEAEADWHEAEARRFREYEADACLEIDVDEAHAYAIDAKGHETAAARLRALLPKPLVVTIDEAAFGRARDAWEGVVEWSDEGQPGQPFIANFDEAMRAALTAAFKPEGAALKPLAAPDTGGADGE